VNPGDSRAAEGVRDPIPRALLRLALPVFASQLLRIGYQWVDALWVRGLGVDATAAVTSSVFVLWWVWALNDTFAIGATAFVSQLIGAGDRRRAGVAAWTGLRASFAMGLLASAVGLLAAREVFGLMSHDGRTVETGARYLSIVLAGAPLPMMAMTCESVMRAAGDTRTPLLLDCAAVALNAVLAPLMIYGVGPFPRLEVAGAAWSTLIAQALLLAGYLTLAARGHRAFPLARRAPGLPVRVLDLARVGAPAALIGALFSVVYIAFSRAASASGPAAMAVVGIANRVEALQFATSLAIGTAGAALVGQNLGAGRPDRAEQVLRTGLRWGVSIAAVYAVAVLVAPAAFLRLFSEDPEVLRLGVPYLWILALCIPVNALEIVTAETLMGSGHTRTMSVIFTAFSLARIPLAFLVPAWTGSGVIGIAWVITITCVLRSLMIVAWASRGTWKSGLGARLGAGTPQAPAAPEGA
jgi:putative MATE family efflux protein